MKKEKILTIIIIIVSLVFLMTIGGLINKLNNYKGELSKLQNEYTGIVTENSNLKGNIDKLNENIYNLFERKPYELSIEHNNTRITYQQDKFGLFDSYTQSTIY